MKRALERHQANEARVIPVFLRPTDWENAPFAHLQGLPSNGKAIITWDHRDLAFTEIVRELRRAIKPQDSIFVSPPSEHNREVMLKKVHDIWITGVLEQSLYRELLIELGLEKRPKLVENPWRIVVQETDQPAAPLPPGTSITQAYDRTDGSLLILGAPGAGKTTLLLSLARTLLERAHEQKNEPMPVVFHLSTWSQQQLPLEEWLVIELHDRYGIPQTLGKAWVKNKHLFLLLDGLDEVAPSARKKCITTINQYREQFPFVPLVVCSRHQDYLDIPVRLRLHSAILIQPLADEQIEEYLVALGEEVAGLHEVLHEDDELRTLASTPLLLSILVLAYQGKSHETISGNRLAGGAQEQVFASYVERMLTRRGVDKRYSSQKTTRWLAILAKQMKSQNQTLFSIEQMQPTWLPNTSSRHLYTFGGVRVLGILFGVLITLIFTFFLFIPTINTPPAEITSCILVGGFLGSLLSRTQHKGESSVPTRNSFKRRILARGTLALSTGIVMAIAVGSSFEIFFSSLTLQQITGILLIIGFPCFLLTLFVRAETSSLTTNQEERERSRKSVFRNLFRPSPLRSGGLVGSLAILTILIDVGLYLLLFGGLFSGNLWDKSALFSRLATGLAIGFIFGLLSALLSFLLADKNGKIQVVERLTWTWRSLWQSLKSWEHLKNTLLFGLLLLVVAGLGGLLVLWSSSSAPDQGSIVTGLITLLSIVFSGATIYWIIFGLFRGVSSRQLNERERMVPNQGIHRSAWNGLRFGFIGGSICLLVPILTIGSVLAVILVSYTIFTWIHNPGAATTTSSSSTSGTGNIDISIFFPFLPPILVFVFASSLLIGLQTGWLAYLRHYLLRWLLWFNGSIPWNYAQFLDCAAERLLLCKAGGGYIFMHRLLLDYLASLDISLIEREMSALPARKDTPVDLAQTPIIHQRRSTGHKIRSALFVEVILLLTLTCSVSLFGEVQEHIYNVSLNATANAYYSASTATAIATHNSYLSSLSEGRTLAFVDPLSQESGSKWSSSSTNSPGGTCQFTEGVYHVSQQADNYSDFMDCRARGMFSNFAFEVQLAIAHGECGGMTFRENSNGQFYYFEICQNGLYKVIKYAGHGASDAKILHSDVSYDINTDLNQQNKIAVVANGSTMTFYVNEQQINQEQDSSYTSGEIGLIAYPEFGDATDVAYTNVRVWT